MVSFANRIYTPAGCKHNGIRREGVLVVLEVFICICTECLYIHVGAGVETYTNV